jgi:hypothetical protein
MCGRNRPKNWGRITAEFRFLKRPRMGCGANGNPLSES